MGRNVYERIVQGGEMSTTWQNVQGANRRWGELSVGRKVYKPKDQLSQTNPARRTAARRTCDKSGAPLAVTPFEFRRDFRRQKT